MPKTGTSSMQGYIYNYLADRRFHCISLHEINGSRALSTISTNEPAEYWIHRPNRINIKQAAKLKWHYTRHLDQSLKRARLNGQTAILSGEGCWHLKHEELQRLKRLIHENGFAISIIAYLRPHWSWPESPFQQNVEWGRLHHNPLSPCSRSREYGQLDFAQNFNRLADVFGESSLTVRPFLSSDLAEGCGVHDFCAQTGINDQGTAVPLLNDCISLDAIRLPYARPTY